MKPRVPSAGHLEIVQLTFISHTLEITSSSFVRWKKKKTKQNNFLVYAVCAVYSLRFILTCPSTDCKHF